MKKGEKKESKVMGTKCRKERWEGKWKYNNKTEGSIEGGQKSGHLCIDERSHPIFIF
jgi:hypothetical protein